MKKTLSLNLLFSLILLANSGLHAEDIWVKNFSNDQNKGYWGSTVDVSGVEDWILDVSQCTLSDDADYVKVVETSGGRMEAVDCDGEAIWKSKEIDISQYTNCNISIKVSETGTSTNSEKYIKLYYQVDNGTEIPFETNAENVGNWGSLSADTKGIEGNSIHIIVKLSNPLSSNKVFFDDVQVSGDPVVKENDAISLVNVSQNTLNSHLIDTQTDTGDEAIACFRFAIEESNAATDNLPTQISRMCFYNAHPDNSLDWETQLGGIILYASDQKIEARNINITADSIVMDFDQGQVDIPEKSSKEFELRAFLNSTQPQQDGQNFQLEIKAQSRGFDTYPSGSGLSHKSELIQSAIHHISVSATDIRFTQSPEKITRNHYFSVSLEAVDPFGNTDLDDSSAISIGLAKGDSLLQSIHGFSSLMNQGKYVFDSLRYSGLDTIQLQIKTELYDTSLSDQIPVQNTYESTVLASSWIPADSLVSSLCVNENQAVKVFEFACQDGGKDDLPLLIQKLVIDTGNANQMNLTKSLAGAFLVVDNTKLYASIDIQKDRLIFDLKENPLRIESESSKNLALYVFLAEGAVNDGECLQFRIGSNSSDWEIDTKGSGLKADFGKELLGPKFYVDVQATQMRFATVPHYINISESFTVEVELLDDFGNRDIYSTKQVTLSVAAGKGKLASQTGLVKKSGSKFVVWDDLRYDKAEYFSLQAQADQLETILSDEISAVDRNSSISLAESNSSDVLDPFAIDSDSAYEVFHFTVQDSASFDSLPSIITQAKFYRSENQDAFDWKTHIAGAVLKSEGKIIANTTTINADCLIFSSSKGVLQVAGGEAKKFELGLYFKKSLLPDHQNLQVYIPSGDHGWKTATNSSEISKYFPDKLESKAFHFDIQADRLKVIAQPFSVADSSTYFRLKVAACDAFKNIDLDLSEAINLELLDSDGNLRYPENQLQMNHGIASIDSIQYLGKSNFRIRVYSDLLADTCFIYAGKPVVDIHADFESGDLSEFINTSDWAISSYQPIKGNQSLKHNLTEQSGQSFITREIPNWSAENGSLFWQFVLKNGNWDPSSGNYFVLHLLMDQADPEQANLKYSLGVNVSGSNDLLSLWKSEKASAPQLLTSSTFNWNKQETLAIQVRYTAEGKWRFFYNRLGEEENFLPGSEEVSSPVEMSPCYTALDFHFETASRTGQLWMDDFCIQATNTPPFLKTYQIMAPDSILLYFSEALDSTQIFGPQNVKLFCNEEEIQDMTISRSDNNQQLVIKLSDKLQTGNYRLKVFEIRDLNRMELDQDQFEFEYLAPAEANDVVINEIMADESPTQGLPEYEYLELYNTRDYPISVQDWKLKVGDKECILKADTLSAHSYLILCSTSAAEAFLEYGKSMGVSNFPGLTNAGATVQILSPQDDLLDEISYSDSWYQSAEKSNGGWSLERIDPGNTCSTESNWKVAESETGGTPGAENSVYGSYVDQKAPGLISLQITAVKELHLEFDEELFFAAEKSNYQLNGNEVADLNIDNRTVDLHFTNAFTDGEEQELHISNLQDECGNVLDTLVSFTYHQLHAHDVVINEIMADESPTQGLPEYEYIELYNTRDYPISVEDWKLKVGDKECILKADTLSAHSYLILCSTSAAESFSGYGKSMGVSNFPSLTNAGATVQILSPQDDLLDEISYSDSWYQSAEKSNGGWSLERIDPGNTCSTESNWKVAESETGGTPGAENSVYGSYVDQKAPGLISLQITAVKELHLEFDEELFFAAEKSNYQLNGNEVSDLNISNRKVDLHFTNAFTDGEEQELHISNLQDECGNVLDTLVSFTYHQLHAHDVVINEIMADESPTQGLPEYEYIELYNTRDYPISVQDWKLKVGDKECILKADTLLAHSYLILCSTSAAESFSDYGKSMGVSNFPGLTNAGATVQILSPQGDLLDEISYSDFWYQSAEKSNGGWSLERIDPGNTCSTESNWKVAESETGGTPGVENSVYGSYVDQKAPGLISLQITAATELHLEFDEELLFAAEKSNYQLNGNEVSDLNISNRKVDLHFTNAFTDGEEQELHISNLQDECGNVLDTLVSFTYHQLHAHDVVINEIMADESPTQGLPEYEYIELYNTRDYPISVQDWKLKVGDKECILKADTLSAHSYLILCSTSAAESFSDYGKSMGVSNFPGLTNAGATIQILSPQGDLLDEISYSDSWYQSTEKSNGGWSLERIDPGNSSWQELNWKASMADNGGTPGKQNSVHAENKDDFPPRIVNIKVLDPQNIQVFFSEPIMQDVEIMKENMQLNPGKIHPKWINNSEETRMQFELYFTDELQRNTKYDLLVADAITDLAGNPMENSSYEFWIPDEIKSGDIVINEVLFNPLPGGVDYVELFNRSQKVIRLSDLYLANRDEEYQISNRIQIESERSFLPNTYLLLTNDSLNIVENYFTNNPNVFVQTKLPSYPDQEGRVVLTTDSELIDDFAYRDDMHFGLLSSTDGVALERINPSKETNSDSNWQSAAQNIGFGTPGLQNSVYSDEQQETTAVSLSSKIFTPDNDGVDDRLYINFNLAEDGYVANVRIFNSMGQEIRKLSGNLYLGMSDQIYWDGLKANRERVPMGIYMLYIELFNPNGDQKVYKKTCVLGGRLK